MSNPATAKSIANEASKVVKGKKAKAEPKEAKKAKPSGPKYVRHTFVSGIKAVAKSAMAASSTVRKVKTGLFEQTDVALRSYLEQVATLAGSFASGRETKTLAIRDLQSALLTMVLNGKDAKSAEANSLAASVTKVGRDKAGSDKAAFLERLVKAYGKENYQTRTRKIKGKEIVTTFIQPSRVVKLFLKKTGFERIAAGVGLFLALHAQVMVKQTFAAFVAKAEAAKKKTISQLHAGLAVHDNWFAARLFQSIESTVGLPWVTDSVNIPFKKDVLAEKRARKAAWREKNQELMSTFRSIKAKKSHPKKNPTSEPKAKKPKTQSKSKPKSQSKPKSKSQTKPKSQSKPKAKSQSKPRSQSKPKTQAKPKAKVNKTKKVAGGVRKATKA